MKFTICFRKRSVSQSVWKSFEEISVTIFKLKNSSYNWNITSFFLLYSKEALISINNFFSNSKHSRYICEPKAKYVQSRLEFLKFARCSKFDPNDRSKHRAKRSVVTENPNGTIGGESPFATYLTVPRKPTSSLITQRNLPTFPRNPRKETKAKIEGARKEQRFLSPFPTSPKNRFFHFFSSYFLSHIYIYFSLFGDDIFTFLRLFAEHL